jgi:hypothetical protein
VESFEQRHAGEDFLRLRAVAMMPGRTVMARKFSPCLSDASARVSISSPALATQ